MNRRSKALALTAAALLFGGAVLAQIRLDGVGETRAADELMFLPNEKLLTHFTGGMGSVVADLLWLQCVQYTAEQAQGERSFKWLDQMVTTVVRLDPYFVDVYKYGSVFLAALRADSDASLKLIHHGMVVNPDSWELPYQAAMNYLLNRRDRPEAKVRGAHYLAMSAATGHAPDFVTQTAAALHEEQGLADVERDMWRGMAASEDRMLREMAERKLVELDIRDTCRVLNERLAQYVAQRGARPGSLAELGLKTEQDLLGGRFFFDAAGVVRNTTVLNEKKQKLLNVLEGAIERYHADKGAWPPDVETLTVEGFVDRAMPHPYARERWDYDPATGVIR